MIAAERTGQPLLIWRDSEDNEHILELARRSRLTVGRSSACDLTLSGDREVSRTHAELQRVADDWTIVDEGLSRNGTFVNGDRITQRRRLANWDVIRIGRTVLEYRRPEGMGTAATTAPSSVPAVTTLSTTQRRVLAALCRPYRSGSAYVSPPSNRLIADEVGLGLDAVKNHLRLLFQRFDLSDLPQNEKRARLAELAIEWGLIGEADL